MSNKSITVTAWNNGKHFSTGAGYGIEIRAKDRDKYFDTNWKKVILQLDRHPRDLEINITGSFWAKCAELRSKDIGIWLIENKKAPWQEGRPPKMVMELIKDNKFKISI